MRKFIIVAATAGLGLWATSAALAAPVNGAAIGAAASAADTLLDVGGCYRCGGWHCPPRKCWRWDCRRIYKWQR